MRLSIQAAQIDRQQIGKKRLGFTQVSSGCQLGRLDDRVVIVAPLGGGIGKHPLHLVDLARTYAEQLGSELAR